MMARSECSRSKPGLFGQTSRRPIMPRAKTSPERTGSSKNDEPRPDTAAAPAETETKVDDVEKNGGVAVATEKEEAPAARNVLPAGETLNLADLQAMTMPRLQKMARDRSEEHR